MIELPLTGVYVTVDMTRSELKLETLNTVETSVETWTLFCAESLKSEFYKVARAKGASLERAASLTLLRNYLSTFSETERERLERDAEFFYGYARGFIEELSPFRYSKVGYDQDVRALFLSKIKTLLRAHRNPDGSIKDEEGYVFIRTIVRICSSLDFIIKVHDDYKKFLFREMPQFRTAQPVP
ncbi:MAG: hypothetical protein JNM27_04715 [Leptospirales bacterium]|nr:hypothetical protein [Leptospirales bacterium]